VASPLSQLGKLLLGGGLALAAVGGLLLLADRFPWLRLGRLPGDISVERARLTTLGGYAGALDLRGSVRLLESVVSAGRPNEVRARLLLMFRSTPMEESTGRSRPVRT